MEKQILNTERKTNKNPIYWIAIFIGYIFYPLTFIPKVKNEFMPLLKLINTIFTGSPTFIFFALFYPLIFVGILPNVASPHYIIFGITSLIPMIVGVQVLPLVILNLKNSSLLKRLGATDTKTSDLNYSFIFYFSILSLISTFFNFGLGLLIYKNSINLDSINWLQVMISIVIGTLVGITFGVFIAGVMKNYHLTQMIGLLLTIPGAFMTAEFLSVAMVADWGPVKYISFIFPQKIATTLTLVSTNGGDIFAMKDVSAVSEDSIKYLTKTYKTLVGSGQGAFIEGLIFNTSGNWIVGKEIPSNFNEVVRNWAIDGGLTPDVLITKTEIIMAWSIAPTFIIGMSFLTAKTFKWGGRW